MSRYREKRKKQRRVGIKRRKIISMVIEDYNRRTSQGGRRSVDKPRFPRIGL